MSCVDSRHLGSGRQYGSKIEEIKPNHRHRYTWASKNLIGQDVVDAGCGTGYGSWMLAGKCSHVTGLEFNPAVAAEARRIWSADNLIFRQWDLCGSDPLPSSDAVVAFEVIEHLVRPERFLCSVAIGTTVFGSVPHAAYVKHTILVNPFHIKHYTYEGLGKLLERCGYPNPQWHYQYKSEVEPGQTGNEPGRTIRTLSFIAVHEHQTAPPSFEEYASDVLRELLRRSCVINDLKNGRRELRAETAF